MTRNDQVCAERDTQLRPAEAESNDVEVLRAALLREASVRARAECTAKMQAHVVTTAR